MLDDDKKGHNPYFNRWFSAIQYIIAPKNTKKVTILILIDGFLQLRVITNDDVTASEVTILILIDGFLQCNEACSNCSQCKSQSLF